MGTTSAYPAVNEEYSGSTPPRKSSARLGFLDAVRGIAALVVVIYHTCWISSPAFLAWSRDYFDFGQAGVTAFFLVSGFVIPLSLERHGSLSFFWKGRFLRLYPLYWFTIAAALILGFAGLFHLPEHEGRSLLSVVLVNLTMFQDFLRTPTISNVYWTLPLEMIFYIGCSLAFWRGILKHSVLLFLGVLGLLLVADLTGEFVLHHAVATARLVMIVTSFYGTLVYRAYHSRLSNRNLALLAIPFAAVIAHGFWFRASLHLDPNDPGAISALSSISAWLAGGVIFFLAYALRDHAVARPLLYFGRISYSVYLIHPLVIEALPASLALPLKLAVVLVVTCLVAHATFRFIEAPLMALHAKQKPGRVKSS